MGYQLHTFICKQADANAFIENFDKARNIRVKQGLSLIPMTEELFDQINNFVISNSVEKFTYLTDNVEAEILQVMEGKKIAYVEADYFGGQGGQAAIIWFNHKRQYLFKYGQQGINEVLKTFGVKAAFFKDEFETIGLGRHRDTNDWLEVNE